ncbi:MAG: nucleotidyltransferase family protein [Fimbriimonadaceae bacterium]
MTGIEALNPFKQVIQTIASRHGASNIRVFGSFARGEARPDSDLDLLVDMADDRNLLDTVGLIQDLQEALGRKVDVITEPALHRLLKARILSEARPL